MTFTVEPFSIPPPSPPTPPLSGFPFDANMQLVKTTWGAKGDGITDDTAAIQNAINNVPAWPGTSQPYLTQIVWFEPGTYLISSTLKRTSGGTLSPDWFPDLILAGAGQGLVTIKMKDGAFGTGVAGIYTAGPFGATSGASNFAFNNAIHDLTVDVGNNSGAYGIDYCGCNMAVVRNVTIKTSFTAGIGLSATRAGGGGPCLLTNITVTGAFRVGLDIGGNTSVGVYADTITINGATQYGLRNTTQSVAFNNVSITMNGGYAFANIDPPNPDSTQFLLAWESPGMGLIVGVNSTVAGTGTGNILNTSGSYNFRNVSSTLNSTSVSLDGIFHGATQLTNISGASAPLASWQLTVNATPAPVSTPTNLWVRVAVTPNFNTASPQDLTAAIQTAVNTPGASVIYIPCGYYKLSGTITVPDNIDRIDGLYSNFETHGGSPYYIFTINSTRTKNLEIFRFVHQVFQGINGLILWNTTHATANLILRDTAGFSFAATTVSGASSVYLDNMSWPHLDLESSSQCWARNLDTETSTASDAVINNGTNLWILGHTTEGHNIKINSSASANTEVVGGCYFLNSQQTALEGPQFKLANSRMAASYVEADSNVTGAATVNQFDVTIGAVDTLIPYTSFPVRSTTVQNRTVAWWSTDAMPITTVFLNLVLPHISGSHVGSGNVLTATTGTWYINKYLEGSPNPTSFQYQWFRAGASIGGATSSTYTTVLADIGTNLTVGVIAVNSVGNSAQAVSPIFNITATYVGAGDTASGWLAWYGLRGFSAAYATGSNFGITVRRDSDNTTQDIKILASGDLDVSSATTFAAGANLFITKIYDQTGNGFHLTQATAIHQPKLSLGATNGGTLPLINFSASTMGLNGSFTTVATAPILSSVIAQAVSTPLNSDNFFGAFDFVQGYYNEMGPNNDGLTWAIYNGSPSLNFSASNSVLHAANAIFNGASSSVNLDGASTTGTVGTRLFSNVTTNFIGGGASGGTASGFFGEAGYLSGASATTATASLMRTNQSLYWGTP